MNANQTALDAALEEWSLDIREGHKRGNARIKHYAVASCAWSWLATLIARKLARRPWCGWFAGHCWRLAGLKVEHCRRDAPSTYRLDRMVREGNADRLGWEELAPGDVAIVGHRKRYGDHVVRIIRIEGDLAYTVEGNATGRLPRGTNAEGVVKRTRNRLEFRYGVRPRPTCYE